MNIQDLKHKRKIYTRSKRWIIEIIQNKAQIVWDWIEFKTPEGTRRIGPPFPINLSTKTQESIPLIPSPREEREGTERERRVAPGRGWWRVFCLWQALQERGEGEGYLRCPRMGPKYPRLNLDTKTPVGAKPEICTRSHSTAEFFFFDSKPSPQCRHIDEDPVRGFGGSAKPG